MMDKAQNIRHKGAKGQRGKARKTLCLPQGIPGGICAFEALCLCAFSVLYSGCTGFGPARKSKKVETTPVVGVPGRNVIRSIEFRGNHAYKDAALQKKIGFETGDYLDPVLAETGRGIINDLYRKKGYPHATIIIDAAKVELGNVIYIIDEGPRVRIRSVKFQGNSGIKTGDLRNAVKTSTRRWIVRPAYYTEDTVIADVERLRRIYYREGYLDIKARATGESHITFIIDEGPLYRVGDIVLTGNTQFSSETLLSGFELEPGDAYSVQKADLQAREMLKLYRENGYVDATVTQRPQFMAEAKPQ